MTATIIIDYNACNNNHLKNYLLQLTDRILIDIYIHISRLQIIISYKIIRHPCKNIYEKGNETNNFSFRL